jgi:hypothetical protein
MITFRSSTLYSTVLLLSHNGVTSANRKHAGDGLAFIPADVGRLRIA